MKKRIITLLAVVALLVTCAVFTVQAVDVPSANTAPLAYNGTDACPHCGLTPGTDFEWVEMEAKNYAPTEDLHLKVTSPLTLTGNTTFNTAENVEVAIWVQSTITVPASYTLRFGNSKATTVAWLIGGGGTISGPGYTNASNGSLIRTFTGATLYITNALTMELTNIEAGADARAGVLDINASTVYMQGGTINGYNSTSTSTKGGAVYLRNSASSKFIMSGGTVNGGNVVNGGAIYAGANGEVTIEGTANVYGGTVTSGGAIYTGGAPVTIQGNAYIEGGKAASGGAIRVAGGSATVQGNATITGGEATDNGGNIYVNNGTVTVAGNALIDGGEAVLGGNVYATYSSGSGRLVMTGGTIQNGVATKTAPTTGLLNDLEPTGGNVWIGRSASATISGGTIQDGTAANGAGGNIGSRGTVTISGNAQLKNGTAKQGGNIYCCDVNPAPTTLLGEENSNPTMQGNLTISGGTISGGTATDGNGGAVYVNGAGLSATKAAVNAVLDKDGDGVLDADPAAVTTSIFTRADGFNMTGGTISGGTASNYGGSVYFKNTNFEMSGNAGITGGTANRGGGVYTGAPFTMDGVTITGGQAGRGGAVYAASTFTMKNGAMLTGGDAGQGGNLFCTSTATVTNSTITLGEAKTGLGNNNTGGGNIYAYSGTLTLKTENGGTTTISEGSSVSTGGNIVFGNTATDAATLNIGEGVSIVDGDADTFGGNIYAMGKADSGKQKIVMTGGSISGGEADLAGTAKQVQVGANVYLSDLPMTMTGGTITVEPGNVGDGISCMNQAALTLGGDAAITSDKNQGNVYLAPAADLLVQAGFTGEAALYTWNRLSAPVYGTKLTSWAKEGVLKAAGTTTATGAFTGKLTHVGTSEGDTINSTRSEESDLFEFSGNLGIVCGATNNGTVDAPSYDLYIAAAGVSSKDADADTYTMDWYLTAGEAQAAAEAAEGEYLELVDGAKTTYHEVSVAITGISLRPGTAGIYYTAKLECDETIAPELTYGVAVKTGSAIGDDLTGTAYTEADYEEDGKAPNSMLVNKILYKDGEVDKVTQDRADKVIFAKAYIEYNGAYIMSEAKNYCLTTLLEAFADRYEAANAPTAAQKLVLKNFCTTYTAINADLWSGNEKIATIMNYEEV